MNLLRTVDDKGRVMVGSDFAGKQVVVRPLDTTIHKDGSETVNSVEVAVARAVSERELTLLKDPKTLTRVRKGIQEARDGKIGPGPDIWKEDVD